MTANLARILTDTAARHPNRRAVQLDGTTLTYRQLDDAVARCAGLLVEAGIRPGDRVGIMLPNVPYFPIAYYGVLRMGGVVVPMNVLLKGRETAYYLTDPQARAVLAWQDFADTAGVGAEAAGAELVLVKPGEFEGRLAAAEPYRQLADRAAGDTAVILYTSGTTGTPKGAELSSASLYTNAAISAETLGHFTCDDVILGALPLFHTFGQTCSMNAAMYAGALLTMLPRFDAGKALEVIQRDAVTVFQGVPTMFAGMLNHPDAEQYDVSSLRVCFSGGAAIPVEVLKGFEAKFGCVVLEGYGLSETSPVASFNHPDRERKAGSIGTPIEGVEMKIGGDDGDELPDGEIGQIWVRGHNIMNGYWRRPAETTEVMRDGWFATGDLARRDEDGYYYIVDRKKDMILRAGYNVYPREVEEVLYEHPAVREAAVVGMPHSDLGEEVAAAVVLKEGRSATPDELREHVKERVAAYKYPRVVWLTDELPKGPTGKILKREIQLPDDAG